MGELNDFVLEAGGVHADAEFVSAVGSEGEFHFISVVPLGFATEDGVWCGFDVVFGEESFEDVAFKGELCVVADGLEGASAAAGIFVASAAGVRASRFDAWVAEFEVFDDFSFEVALIDSSVFGEHDVAGECAADFDGDGAFSFDDLGSSPTAQGEFIDGQFFAC